VKNKLLFIVLIAAIGFSLIACVINKDGSIGLSSNNEKQVIRDTARQFAEELSGRIDGYIETLQSLSNEMSLYENLATEARRREYEDKIQSAFEDTPDFVQIFTVLKPNATGQFSFALTRENGEIEKKTGDVFQTAMAYLTGPDSKTVKISDPAEINLERKDIRYISIMIPVLNDRTNEPVGVIGSLIDLDSLQNMAIKTIMYNDEVTTIVIYTNTGLILATYMPWMIGQEIGEEEKQYGKYLDKVVDAVKNSKEFECSSFDPELNANIFMCVTPVFLTYSPVKWAVTLGSTEGYIYRNVKSTVKTAITLIIIVGMVGIIVFVIIIDRRKKKNGI